jgi:hypothetical protein
MRNFQVRELWDNGRLKYGIDLPADLVHRALERGDRLAPQGINSLFCIRTGIPSRKNGDRRE